MTLNRKRRASQEQRSQTVADSVHSNHEEYYSLSEDDEVNPRGRNITTLSWLTVRKPEEPKVKVGWNTYDQPEGDNALLFVDCAGVFMRTSLLIDWTLEWPKVDDLAKEDIWRKLKNVWELEEERRESFLKTYCSNLFRGKKTKWKRKFYTPYPDNKTRVKKYKRVGISKDQWIALVQHWGTERHQIISQRNKKNRSLQNVVHTNGRTSIACMRKKMTIDNVPPSRGELYVHSHKKENDTVSQARIKEMKERAGTDAEGNPNPITDEHYYEVMPRDKHGRVMGMGPGVLPSKYYGSRGYYSHGNTSNEIEELKQDLERKLQEKTEQEVELQRKLQEETNRREELEKKMEEQNISFQSQLTEIRMLMKGAIQPRLNNTKNVSCSNNNLNKSQSDNTKQNFKLLDYKCKLLDHRNKKVVVDEGRRAPCDRDTLVHGQKLGEHAVKVWVDKAVVPKAPLWRSSFDLTEIMHAINSVVAWPTKCVIMENC